MTIGSAIIESVTIGRIIESVTTGSAIIDSESCDYRKCNLRKGDNIMWSVIVDEITLKSSITKTEPFQILQPFLLKINNYKMIL